MAAPALSFVTDRSERFRLTWRGYDRAEVDAFLKRTAADRQRLQTDLAQVEAALADHDVARRQELERLEALRTELAQCLETSVNALHIANLLLSSPVRHDAAQQHETVHAAPASGRSVPTSGLLRDVWPLPAWLSPGRTLLLVGALSAGIVVLPAVANGDHADDSAGEPARPPASVTADAAPPVAVRTLDDAPATPASQAPAVDGLALTLTATNECWIRSTIDGGEPRERLLKPGEAVTLRAGREAVLRIGDPAALALQINGRPARPLGAAGRVVTARITLSNYLDLLAVR